MKVIAYHFRLCSLVLGIVVYSGNSWSQSDTINESIYHHQLWIDIYPHYYISEKWEYYGDIGYRTIISASMWHRIYVRPSLRYHLNDRCQLQGGVEFFYIFNDVVSNRFEVTPWQGVQLNWPTLRNLKFKNLFRFEQRNSFDTDSWSYSFDLRLRFKVSGPYDFSRECSDQFWFASLYAEGFLPINDGIKSFFGIEDELELDAVIMFQGNGPYLLFSIGSDLAPAQRINLA